MSRNSSKNSSKNASKNLPMSEIGEECSEHCTPTLKMMVRLHMVHALVLFRRRIFVAVQLRGGLITSAYRLHSCVRSP
jgi:hypothetical protein